MNCPGTEQAAAYADGRLEAAEAALFLEHCAECDECRRTLAILVQPREESPVPQGMESRAIAALRRSLDRERTPRPFRRVVSAQPQNSSVGMLIAAALLLGFVVLVLSGKQSPSRPVENKEVAVRAPVPEPRVVVEPPPPPAPEVQRPAPKPEVDEPLRPAKFEEPKFEVPPAPVIVQEPSKIEETRPEEPAKAVTHTATARALTEIQVTDIAGPVTVHRKGAKSRERLSGVARLGEGDVVTAEKAASFQVEGRHPVVLSENASISMAYAPQEQAPWLSVQAGEATVDSTTPSRWVVTDGSVAVAIKPAKARFTASRRDSRLALAAHTETLYLQPDGGKLHSIHPGEELQVSRSAVEVKPVDAAISAKRASSFESMRPRQRTVFYTSCDPADAKREHFFVQEGQLRSDGLFSRERTDRTAAAAIAPNPRFSWRDTLTLRFRYATNCKSVEVQMRVDEKKYTLVHPLPVDRKTLNQWQSVEITFALSGWPVFRRDDNGSQLVVSTEDKFDQIRFSVRQQDVFGDARAYVVIDDIQVVEREKD